MKKFVFIFLLIGTFQLVAQNLSDYQYVMVPTRFNDFDEENQYRLNTITKFNLEKMGFIAFYENSEVPMEVSGNRCAVLNVDLVKGKHLFWTKVNVVFKDCFGKIVYQSPDGKTKEKEYKAAYQEALQNAFTFLFDLNYKYNGTKVVTPTTSPSIETPKAAVSAPVSEITDYSKLLFAQPTATGFQLVDSTPKVVFKLFKTDSPTMFIAQKGNQNGVVSLKDGSWLFEYQENEKVVSEKLEIKF